MLGTIINEQIIIDKALNENKIEGKPMGTLRMLMKHYFILEMTESQNINQLLSFLSGTGGEYKLNVWKKPISEMVQKYYKDKRIKKSKLEKNGIVVSSNSQLDKLIIRSNVNITKDELKVIDEIENKKLQRMAFIVLVYAKLGNQTLEEIKDKTVGWVSIPIINICNEALVKGLLANDKLKLLYDLSDLGLTECIRGNSSHSFKVKYINEESETVLVVDDFDGVIYSYLNYIGEKWKKCECCSKYVKQKSDKPQRYCSKCAKEINIKQTINRKMQKV